MFTTLIEHSGKKGLVVIRGGGNETRFTPQGEKQKQKKTEGSRFVVARKDDIWTTKGEGASQHGLSFI